MRFPWGSVGAFIYSFMLIGVAVGQTKTQEVSANVSQRICANLVNESKLVLGDSSETSKYLSPNIAAEIYQQVVVKSLDEDEIEAPAMVELPCSDIVSDFMMAIKKRMEYNRIDHFIASNRVLFYGSLVLLLVGGFNSLRRQRQSLRKDNTEVVS